MILRSAAARGLAARSRRGLAAAALAVCLGAGCRGAPESEVPPGGDAAPPSGRTFADATAAAGLAFRHSHGGTGQRYMPETMGSGGGFFDYDGDGLADLYLVNAGPTPGYAGPPIRDALYRNLGDGKFRDVTAAALPETGPYGMGVTFGDYDGDGDTDVYVTQFGPNRLLANRGDGSFEDVTGRAGVGDPRWSASAAFGDADGDGDLDLYVTNYVDFTYANHKWCGDRQMGIQAYCHPDVYDGVPDSLYLNRGDGTFVDASRERLAKSDDHWRREGKGLGVLFTDYDGDSRPDIYVANDSTPNFLWHNLGAGRFEDRGLFAGGAFNADGKTEAGMGVAAGDADRDGRLDLFVTNLDLETNTLYRNRGEGLFEDATFTSGVGPPSWLLVGFGTAFVDYDLDGWLDLVVANGHIIDNVAEIRDDMTWAQPSLLLRNRGGGTFAEVTRQAGTALATPAVSRGLAVADYDADGDPDLLLTRNQGPAALLRNDGPAEGRWLGVHLVGSASGTDAYGTRLRVAAGGLDLVEEHRSASSYLSQSEPACRFGLGRAARVEELEVRWPSGRSQRFHDLPVDRELVVVEEGAPRAGR